ncbi:MAG: hypothetical protein IIY78_07675, partial [Clostridia bacterium]|nr:hypothetical protein [Clostridia bacterium]
GVPSRRPDEPPSRRPDKEINKIKSKERAVPTLDDVIDITINEQKSKNAQKFLVLLLPSRLRRATVSTASGRPHPTK